MTALPNTPVACFTNAAPFAIRGERASDVVAREALLDAGFGANRHARTCQRLRDGHAPAEGLAFSAVARGRLVGTVRLWHVSEKEVQPFERPQAPLLPLCGIAHSQSIPINRVSTVSGAPTLK